MKIYTKTGDDGTTGLIGGVRVMKDSARLDCYGTVDELNAALGVAATATAALSPIIQIVQSDLFVIGSHLAVADDAPARHRDRLPPLRQEMISRLEHEIDSAEEQLQPLQTFVLPGGCDAAARLQLARSICRRAERLLVHFATDHAINPIVLIYLNRLSDWLFVHARLANHQANVADVPWKPEV